MIIPASFAVASFAITIIKIILSGAISAIIAFYVKHFRDEYSTSLRWSQIGGFFEMVNLYRNTSGPLSKRSHAHMYLMIIASVLTLFISIPLGATVSRTKNGSSTSHQSALTQQPVSTNYERWTNWIAYMEADSTMNATMTSLLNGTVFNPSPLPETIYTPRNHAYEVPCTETAVIISKDPEMTYLYPSPHSCKVVVLTTDNRIFNWDDKKASNQLIAPGMHMVVAPMSFLYGDIYDIEPQFGAFNDKRCTGADHGIGRYLTFPKDGLLALPRTDTTRCQFGSDDSFIVTVSLIKFAVNHLRDFDKVTSMMFDDPFNLPLLKDMQAAINNGTFPYLTDNSTMVLLTNISDNASFLFCASRFLGQPNDLGLICSYMVTATLTTKPQAWDSTVAADLKRNSTLPLNPKSLINLNDIIIYHMPPLVSKTNSTAYSAAHLLEATTNITHYFAALGHNAIMNNETGQFYVLYDRVEFKDAFEISTTFLIVVCCTTVILLVMWLASEIRYPTELNGSLYKLIYNEVKLQEKKTPMLMDFKHGPFAFHGYQVLPDLQEQQNANVEGQNTNVQEQNASVEGQNANVEGQNANVEGQNASVEGQSASVEGQTANVEGQNSDVEGQTANVEGQTANVEGQNANVEEQPCSPSAGAAVIDMAPEQGIPMREIKAR